MPALNTLMRLWYTARRSSAVGICRGWDNLGGGTNTGALGFRPWEVGEADWDEGVKILAFGLSLPEPEADMV